MYKIDDFDMKSKKMMNFQKIIIKIIYVIIIPIIVIKLTLFVKAKVNPTEIPSFLGFKSFVIVSKSMEPTINKEDAIIIRNTSERKLKINDIITFHEEDYINTHRIIDIEKQGESILYKTKGDNNKNPDKKLKRIEDIEGKYVVKIPKIGKFLEIMKSKLTLVILLIILILILMFQTRVNKRELIRKEKRYNYLKKESK